MAGRLSKIRHTTILYLPRYLRCLQIPGFLEQKSAPMCPTMLRVSSNRLRFQVTAIKELTLSVCLHVIIFCQVQKSGEQVMVSAAISLMAYQRYFFFLMSSSDNLFLFYLPSQCYEVFFFMLVPLEALCIYLHIIFCIYSIF